MSLPVIHEVNENNTPSNTARNGIAQQTTHLPVFAVNPLAIPEELRSTVQNCTTKFHTFEPWVQNRIQEILRKKLTKEHISQLKYELEELQKISQWEDDISYRFTQFVRFNVPHSTIPHEIIMNATHGQLIYYYLIMEPDKKSLVDYSKHIQEDMPQKINILYHMNDLMVERMRQKYPHEFPSVEEEARREFPTVQWRGGKRKSRRSRQKKRNTKTKKSKRN